MKFRMEQLPRMAPTVHDWIVIPAHNEAEHIAHVLDEVKKINKNIIVVDDGSRDETPKIAKSKTRRVLRHIVNLGKGAALKTGVECALKNNAKRIIVMDADGQHLPGDIPRFLKALENVDIVFGVRQINKTMPAILRLGNKIISAITFLLHGIQLEDTQCGFRAFKAEIWPKLKWTSTDYGVESEMIANVGKHRLKYTALPIGTIYLDKYKGTTVLTGMRIVMQMIWRKMRG